MNREIVRAGFAWWYERYAKRDTTLRNMESEAQAARPVGRPGPGPALGMAAGDHGRAAAVVPSERDRAGGYTGKFD